MIQFYLRKHPLLVIVLAQLFGTSLWFTVNGVWDGLAADLNFSERDLGLLTLSVQAGFIVGTLLIAISGIADRYRASRIFALSSFIGALFSLLFVVLITTPSAAMLIRFLTGLCLAGIYPLGMKLVISWTPKHAGAALSWLVGMLTLGTALPHLLRGLTLDLPWQWPLMVAALLAVCGGLLVLALGDGAYLPKAQRPSAHRIKLGDGFRAMRKPNFRAIAGGYFGHCWELYAFWMLVPFLVNHALQDTSLSASSLVPWLSFLIIGLGALGCIAGGWLSRRHGNYWVATRALCASGIICLLYPMLSWAPAWLLLPLLMVWGICVIADSPQFSALAANAAPSQYVGSSLAMMNAIGFALTIPAIWIVSSLWALQGVWSVLWLLPGPMLGLCAMRGYRRI